MGVYLHKIGYHPAEADPDTGEIIREAGNDYEKVLADNLDELRDEYVPITLNRGKPNEVTVLLDKTKFPWEAPFKRADGSYLVIDRSTFDPTGLVPSFCQHGPTEHPTTGQPPKGGYTWVRSRLLTIIPATMPPQAACHCLCAEAGFEGCKAEAKGEACPARKETE